MQNGFEEWAHTCITELVINTNLTTNQIRELFLNAFPEYEYVMEEVLMENGYALGN
jgi:hypothetical protein